MTDVNAKTLEDINFEQFKKEIEENFISKKETNGKNKGVYQILHQLKQICAHENRNEISDILKIKNTKRLNIYPILLTSDTNYNIYGTNKYVNDECLLDFMAIKREFQTIRPVLILNVNTLIKYFGYFKHSQTGFTDLVKSYFKEIDKHNKQYLSNKNNIPSYLMSSISFEGYLQKKLKDHPLANNFNSIAEYFSDEIPGINFISTTSK